MNRDYCVSPSQLMQTILVSIEKTEAEVMERCQIDKNLLKSAINGTVQVTPSVANEFERITGLPAQILINQQKIYNEFLDKGGIGKRGLIV